MEKEKEMRADEEFEDRRPEPSLSQGDREIEIIKAGIKIKKMHKNSLAFSYLIVNQTSNVFIATKLRAPLIH